MIEILPNWHPIFVHFTVALFTVSTIFYFLAASTKKFKFNHEFLIVARWCLWLAVIVTIATIIAGFIAYYSVAHDTPSHMAMTVHRNWAIATSITILILACWSWLRYRADKKPSVLFILSMLMGFGLLLVTAWHGSELVYRHGIGVMSLPQSTGVGHQHNHDQDTGHTH